MGLNNFLKIKFCIKAIFLIVVFVGNLIVAQTGIIDQISKIFYWEYEGQVAGEYEVRVAQAEAGHGFYFVR